MSNKGDQYARTKSRPKLIIKKGKRSFYTLILVFFFTSVYAQHVLDKPSRQLLAKSPIYTVITPSQKPNKFHQTLTKNASLTKLMSLHQAPAPHPLFSKSLSTQKQQPL